MSVDVSTFLNHLSNRPGNEWEVSPARVLGALRGGLLLGFVVCEAISKSQLGFPDSALRGKTAWYYRVASRNFSAVSNDCLGFAGAD